MAGRKGKARGKGAKPPPSDQARADELRDKLADAELESQMRAIAAAAKAEEGAIPGPGRFNPRHDVQLDGLPQAESGQVPPPGPGPSRELTAEKSLELLARNLETAVKVSTGFLAELLELENTPTDDQMHDVAEAWGLVLHSLSPRLINTHPELVVAGGVTALAYGPLALEVYLRTRKVRREQEKPHGAAREGAQAGDVPTPAELARQEQAR